MALESLAYVSRVPIPQRLRAAAGALRREARSPSSWLLLIVIVATVYSGAMLWRNAFPISEETKHLLGHAGQATDTLIALSRRGLPDRSIILAVLLLGAVPVTSAMLAYLASKHHVGAVRFASIAILIAAGGSYVAYFGFTYHFGVLILALLAWVVAGSHSAEVGENLKLAVDNSAHWSQLYSASIQAFDSDLWQSIERSRESFVSVERYWTMPTGTDALTFTNRGRSEKEIEQVLNVIRRDELYRALSNAKCSSILIIGRPPLRRNDGFEPSQLSQLLTLVYYACLIEVVRSERVDARLRAYARPAGRALKEADEDLLKSPRVRVHCVVADVPAWVKIVDDSYFQLRGVPPYTFGYTEFRAPTPDDERRAHDIRIRQYQRIVQQYERTAQRAYTYLCLGLLNSYQHTLVRDEVPASTLFEYALPRFITGQGMSYTEFSGRQFHHRGEDSLTGEDIARLFHVFLALHFRKTRELNVGAMHDEFSNTVKLVDIWDRCT